jgi:hypothetical protein
MPESIKLAILCDPSPFLLFAELFKRALEASQRPLSLGDLGFELARFETDHGPAGAGEITVRLYPSDAFLCFAATALAGDFNLCGIEKTSHSEPPEQ